MGVFVPFLEISLFLRRCTLESFHLLNMCCLKWNESLYIVIYSPPKYSPHSLDFIEMLLITFREFDCLVILGDCNIQRDSVHDRNAIFDTFDLTPPVKESTPDRGHTLVITEAVHISRSHCVYLSHYFCMFFDLSFTPEINIRSQPVKTKVH